MINEAQTKKALDWMRLFRLSRWRAQGRIDHADVIAHVREDGRLDGRYGFMVLMSCAIATLGLLLSSPAVIIGAMLISPLMGPIILFGMSLCILDLRALRKSLIGLGIGIALALAASMAIVLLSPLTQATPEILARTKPNLFDLLVATFSGLAGGYAVVNRKGETIVGVAIATALMPPLCVIGFGIATGSVAIAAGALFLFMTNLLAIALSVTAVAKWYGFGASHNPRHTLWQTMLILATFIGLSIPLGLALRDIAVEAQITAQVRSAIQDYYREEPSRLSEFSVRMAPGDKILVDAVVLGQAYLRDAERDLARQMEQSTGRTVVLNLDQVMVNQDRLADRSEILRLAESSLTAPLQTQLAGYQRKASLRDDMMRLAGFKTAGVDVNEKERIARLYAAAGQHASLAALRDMEASLAERYPDWTINVTPPMQSLPPIFFPDGSAELTPEASDTLSAIAWALGRWGVGSVKIIGYSSSTGPRRANARLALARAESVRADLDAHEISGSTTGEFLAFNQRADERAFGLRAFQRVDVRIVTDEQNGPIPASAFGPESLPADEDKRAPNSTAPTP